MEASELVQMIKDAIPNVQAIYLFGSQVDDTARVDSDVDLAMLVQSKPTGEVMLDLKGRLSQLLRRDVDIVDLLRTDTVTAAQVVATGKRLFKDATSVADFFETATLSAYALLNEERADIISNIKQSGTVYDG